MCGICGVHNAWSGDAASNKLISQMTHLIAHRGPDESNSDVDEAIGLAVARLSIIDVTGGHQPMSNETNDMWLIFNRKIWNYQELRRDLRSKARLHTVGDTETAVHARAEYGTMFLTC